MREVNIPAEVQAVLCAAEAYFAGEGDQELRDAWAEYETSLERPQLTEHRTLTVELWAVEGYDFTELQQAIETTLEEHSNAGLSMDWDITAEG